MEATPTWIERVERACSLEPYTPPGDEPCIHLDLNESPFPPPVDVVEEAYGLLLRANRYPRRRLLEELVGELSAYTGAPSESIVVASGGDSIINAVMALMQGLRGAAPQYCFSMYPRLAAVYGLDLERIPMRVEDDEWVIDVGSLEEAAERSDVVILDRPNNPTGGLLASRRLLERLVSEHDDTLFVFDEAYYEFMEEDGLQGLVEYGNVVVVRTMSKAFGLAGMRVGYAVAPAMLARALRNILYPFPVTAPSLAMATAMLRLRGVVEGRVSRIREWREELSSALRGAGVRVFRSHSNFVLADFSPVSGSPVEELRRMGVCVRQAPIGRTYVRISVGRPEENEELLGAVRRLAGSG
ncbi:MAG: histidinol-phosphate aminotransferase family protein [Crenarchaeota archaeon]|nr:histidinol-phosphate aminotransferase family protein [Thermoproteota archaeon]